MSARTSVNPPQRSDASFERRVVFVVGLMLLVTGVLTARLFSLTVVQGNANRAVAQSRLDRATLLPTVRGTITDRKGRPLAQSVPSYDLCVWYSVISGDWVEERAEESARKEVGLTAWNRMSPTERDARIMEHATEWQYRLNKLLDAAAAEAGMDRAELNERIGEIRTQVESKASAVWSRQLARDRNRYGEISEEQWNGRPIQEQQESHVVATQLPTRAAFALRKLADELPGAIEVTDGTRREYPWNQVEIDLDRRFLPKPLRSSQPLHLTLRGVADHIIGSVREDVWAEDLERRPFSTINADGDLVTDLGGYRPGREMVGSTGLERTYEDELRGLRGRMLERLDTGDRRRVEPERGKDIQLTIDIALQARVQALFDPKVGLARAQQWHYGWFDDGTPKPMPLPYQTPLNGAAVVLDVDSGEALAVVTWPTLAEGVELPEDEALVRTPAVNRALETPYPPGSIIKPLVYVSAVRSGAFPVDGTIVCNGHFFGPQAQYGRCWIYRPQFQYLTHSSPSQVGKPLNVEAAISRSCNIFFYTLAQKEGLDQLVEWYRAFGMGQVLDVGVARRVQGPDGATRWVGEGAGILPSAEAISAIKDRGDLVTQVIAGIGQGPIGWTPLQAANAYATLARGGVIKDATVLRTQPAGRPPRRTGDLDLVPLSCDRAMEGLRQAVEATWGTGYQVKYSDGTKERVVRAPGVKVWAKTGTAQAPAMRLPAKDGAESTVIRGLEHGWFVGLVGNAGENRPRYAVAVVLENGGSGGKSAGPIANGVIQALVAEGYLKGDGAAPADAPQPEHGADDGIEAVGGAG
ncbi:MAG: penicillin-binding transpeptidase domain-containing protein [Phycisphaerales bacterium]